MHETVSLCLEARAEGIAPRMTYTHDSLLKEHSRDYKAPRAILRQKRDIPVSNTPARLPQIVSRPIRAGPGRVVRARACGARISEPAI